MLVLARGYTVEVSTVAEILNAFRNDAEVITIKKSIRAVESSRNWISAYEQLLEVSEDCLSAANYTTTKCSNNGDYAYIRKNTVIMGSNLGLHWDLNNLRRRVILQASLTITGMTLQGFFNDNPPNFNFFLFGNNSQLTLRNTVLTSPCEGTTAARLLGDVLENAVPGAEAKLYKDNENRVSVTRVVLQPPTDTVSGSDSATTLKNSSLLCGASLETVPSVDIPADIRPDETCQPAANHGAGYRGTQATTVSGFQCQAWNSLVPNFHKLTTLTRPDSGLGGNYCRNPKEPPRDGGVWCYTIEGPRLELCPVPVCEGDESSRLVPSDEDGDWSMSGFRLWSVVAAGVVLVAVAAMIWWCKKSRKSQHLNRKQPEASIMLYDSDDVQVSSRQHARAGPTENVTMAIAGIEIDEKQLVIGELVGKGAFGLVYRGIWRGLEVAVKTITFQDRTVSDGRVSAQQRAVTEAAITISLSHPNVIATYHTDIKPLKLVDRGADAGGMTVTGGEAVTDWKLYLVQEMCAAGSLREAIESGMFRRAGSPMNKKCISCLLDIARGMRYIHARGIIHGDLNPSNVLLKAVSDSPGDETPATQGRVSTWLSSNGEAGRHAPRGHQAVRSSWNMLAKVCDFGLSVQVDSHTQVLSNMKQGTPFYMAPEVQNSGKMSMAADVHAFGVIMWECYHSKAPHQTSHDGRLQQHNEYPKYPKYCPLSYAVLAVTCLSPDPVHRPKFWQIYGVLEDLAGYLYSGHYHQDTSRAHFTVTELEASLSRDTPANLQPATPPTVRQPDSKNATIVMSQLLSQLKPPSTDDLNGTAALDSRVTPASSSVINRVTTCPIMHSVTSELAPTGQSAPNSTVEDVFYSSPSSRPILPTIPDDATTSLSSSCGSNPSLLRGGDKFCSNENTTFLFRT